MRLLLSILFRTVLAILLLVAVGVVVFRVLDRRGRVDRFEHARAGGRMVWVNSMGGLVQVVAAGPWPEPKSVRWIRNQTVEQWNRDTSGIIMIDRRELSRNRFLGIVRGNAYAVSGADVKPVGPVVPFVMVFAPHWLIAATCALPPLIWVAAVAPKRLRLLRRKRLGLCLECGYDLLESPGRCPECGAIPAKP